MKRWLHVKWDRTLILGVAVAAVLVILDLLIKWLVQNNVGLGDANKIEVIPNFFYINKSYNTAVAFSIGSSWGVGGRVLNILISIVMSVAIFWYYLTHNDRMKTWERVTAVLLGAGAVGNLIDRAFYWEATVGFDGVVDMFQFYLGGGPSAPHGFFNPFATFNFADMCLTIGIVILIVIMLTDLIRNRDTSLEADPRLNQKPTGIKKDPSKEENKEETREDPKA